MPSNTSDAAPRPQPEDVSVTLDAADEVIVELLAEDGRVSNRALAAATGLTEVTVASRLRRLRDLRVVHVTALLDRRTLGYTSEMSVEMRVRDRPVNDVAEDLTQLPAIVGASVVLGSLDIIATSAAADFGQQAAVLATIRSLDGVDHVDAAPILRWHKINSSRASLQLTDSWTPDLAHAEIPLDDLDQGLVRELMADGRQSNRSISRKLGASETTVRARLKRMEDVGLLRIAGVVDRTQMGANRDVAWVGVDVRSSIEEVAAELSTWPQVAALYEIPGHLPLRCLVVTSTQGELGELVGRRLRSIPGVRSSETWLNIRAFAHRYQLSLLT